MTSALRETAYAKINLALHVRRRRDDGYHELETLFAFVGDGDRISAAPADGVSLGISGPFGEGLSATDNLVMRTARLMQAHYAIEQGSAIHLDKRLPVASGIGGGSADAAATARVLNRLWGIGADDAELEKLLAPLGADIPACIGSKTVYGNGVGTALREVPDTQIQGRPVLLVNPLQSVATGPVFKAWDGVDRGGLDCADPWSAALEGRNDLTNPANSICPAISAVLDALAKTDADLVRMSGSGATCFALFASDQARDFATRQISEACPDWWTMASSLR
jgi:4-diphosphocytidyl-2-C-methyl-D-erythritol kinase